MKLTKILSEIRITKTWDLDKPGIDPSQIRVGDTFEFTLFHPTVEKVKQVVEYLKDPYGHDLIKTRDVRPDGSLGGYDYWSYDTILNQHKRFEENTKI